MKRSLLIIIMIISLFQTNVFSKVQNVLFYFNSDNDYRYDVRKKLDKIISNKAFKENISIKVDRFRSIFPEKDVFEDVYKEKNTKFADINSGDPSRLKDILNDGDQILWIYSPGYLKNDKARGFSEHFEPLLFDTSSKDFLNIKELEDILFKKYELIIIDHSLFSSIENIYALRKNFDFLIATQEIIPITGFPIDGFLNSLKDKDTGNSIEAIFSDVKKEYGAKTNGWWGVPIRYQMSLINSDSIDRLILHFRFFTRILIQEYKKTHSEILRARSMSVKFNDDYVDIDSFLSNLKKVRVSRALKEQADNLKMILSKVISRQYFQRPQNVASGGLSVFFPLNGILPEGYDVSEFSKNTGWNDFLSILISEDQ